RDATGESRGTLAAIKELALVAGAFALVWSGLALWIRQSSAPQSGTLVRPRPSTKRDEPLAALFVGDALCRDCHPGPSGAHRRSGHSRTLRRASEMALAGELAGRSVRDREFDALWQFSLEEGSLTATRTEAGKSTRLVLDYAFGSGEHATTFVSLTDTTASR